jgi:hypothetical protein
LLPSSTVLPTSLYTPPLSTLSILTHPGSARPLEAAKAGSSNVGSASAEAFEAAAAANNWLVARGDLPPSAEAPASSTAAARFRREDIGESAEDEPGALPTPNDWKPFIERLWIEAAPEQLPRWSCEAEGELGRAAQAEAIAPLKVLR